MTATTSYDAAGRPTEEQWPDGLRRRWTYDAAGMPAQHEVDRGTGAGYEIVVQDTAYDARGQLTAYQHGNGVLCTRTYDPDTERLTRIFARKPGGGGASEVRFQDLAYAYDPVGNPVQITDREHAPDTTPLGVLRRNLPILFVEGHTDPNHDAAFFATALNLSVGALAARPATTTAGPKSDVLEMSPSGRIVSVNGVPVIRTLELTEREGLRTLFGSNEAGAGQLLDRLRAGEAVGLPEGVTRQTLETYRQVPTTMIDEGKDLRGTQELRRQAIDILLGGQ